MLKHRAKHTIADVLGLIKHVVSGIRHEIQRAITPSVHALLDRRNSDNRVFSPAESDAGRIGRDQLRKPAGFPKCLEEPPQARPPDLLIM